MVTSKMRLGQFLINNDGSLRGKIGAFGIGTIDVLAEVATDAKGKPYFKMIGDPNNAAYEIGVAFPKQKNGHGYYSVQLDSPYLPAPIHGALFHDKNVFGILDFVWNRPEVVALETSARRSMRVAPSVSP